MNTPPIGDRRMSGPTGSSANAHQGNPSKIEAVYEKNGTNFLETVGHDIYVSSMTSQPVFTISEPWIWWCHDYEDEVNCNWLHGLKRLGPPSELPNGFGYYVFKHDATVVKEEPENRHGGKVVLSMKRDFPYTALRVNKCWLELTVCVMSGQLGPDGSVVNGVFVSSCLKTYSLGFWVHSRSSEPQRRFLCEVLNTLATPKDPARYEPHDSNFDYL